MYVCTYQNDVVAWLVGLEGEPFYERRVSHVVGSRSRRSCCIELANGGLVLVGEALKDSPMKNNVGKRGLAKQNHMFFNKKSLNNEVVNGGVGSGSSTEDDTRFNKRTKDGNNGLKGLIQIHGGLQISQQPPQGSIICWERFLHVRSIKVLLVEDDDSTRHVVYEVSAVSSGLQAWKILEDPGNHIDLVLTEVAMPILSGIGLLCKIMSHKTLKNIPVIMMSSHDSMGIVFKCLSKGAVDFLVKPIRRNELKNLWQHVWRRCHSNGDSDSNRAGLGWSELILGLKQRWICLDRDDPDRVKLEQSRTRLELG
ncbi:Two-component response regulator-like APRR7, partial [Mucuna pruriens]